MGKLQFPTDFELFQSLAFLGPIQIPSKHIWDSMSVQELPDLGVSAKGFQVMTVFSITNYQMEHNAILEF